MSIWKCASLPPAGAPPINRFHLALYILLTASAPILAFVFWLAQYSRPNWTASLRRNNSLALVVCAALSCICFAQVGPGSSVFVESYPCWLKSLLFALVIPSLCANLVVKFYPGKRGLAIVASVSVLFFIMFIVVLAIASVGNRNDLGTCINCNITLEEAVLVCVLGVILLVLGLFRILVQQQSCQELEQYPFEFVSLWALALLAYIGLLLWVFLSPNQVWLTSLALWFNLVMQTLVPIAFVSRFWVINSGDAKDATMFAYKEKEEEEETGFMASSPHTSEQMTRILASRKLSQDFHRFLEQEQAAENLTFLLDTDAWKQRYEATAFDSTTATTTRASTAQTIFNQYLAANSPQELNVSSPCATQIRQVFEQREPALVDVPINVFDDARREVEDLLQYGPFARFRSEQDGEDELQVV